MVCCSSVLVLEGERENEQCGMGKELMCEGYKFYEMRFVGKVWLGSGSNVGCNL